MRGYDILLGIAVLGMAAAILFTVYHALAALP